MPSPDLSELSELLRTSAWAILPQQLPGLVALVDQHRGNGLPSTEELSRMHLGTVPARWAVAKALGGRLRLAGGLPVTQIGGVAILSLAGVVVKRPSWITNLGFGTSTEQFVVAHRQLLAEEGVKSIIWDIDSPGGSVSGVPEAAGQLLAMRGSKRTIAFSNTLMASASYWIGSAADEIVSAPSGQTGSIGVVAVHQDRSQANDKAGVSVKYVHAGKYKVEGNPDQPLGGEARAAIQQTIDDFYAQFVGAVAKARRTTAAAVRSGYGEGRVLTAERARAAKLVDRVESLSAMLGRIASYDTKSDGLSSYLMRQRQAEAELA